MGFIFNAFGTLLVFVMGLNRKVRAGALTGLCLRFMYVAYQVYTA